MVSPLNAALLNVWFGQSTAASGVGADLLASWARARAGIGVDASATAQDPNAPLAPVWTPGLSPSAEALVQRALDAKPFFDLGAKLYADLNASGDYRRLFALHSGLSTLHALASRAEDEKLSALDKNKVHAEFARGLAEMEAFFADQRFEQIRLAQADRLDAAQTTLALPVQSEDYVTGVVHRGGLHTTVAGLAADARFDIVAISAAGTERRVAIDLADMGSIPRTLGNITAHINNELAAAGAASRLEAVDKTPKETTVMVGGRIVSSRYTGPRQHALKVDVRAGERVAFEPVGAEPAFYVVGDVAGGARIIKLQDLSGVQGQPVWLARPQASADPIGAHVSAGWTGGVFEARTNALASAGENNFETALRAAGEAVLKLQFADGRTLSVATAWRGGDRENWRALAGQDSDAAIIGDLAERLTQLLHEQGVAARISTWEAGGERGLSIFSDDFVSASSLVIGGRAATLQYVDPAGMSGGLREGVFARRFEASGVAAAGALFAGDQTFTVTTDAGAHTFKLTGGDPGIDAATLVAQANAQLRAKGVAAALDLVDVGGALTLRVDAHHSVQALAATLNGAAHTLLLQAPGAWASGGLPVAAPGQPFGDGLRARAASAPPLLAHPGALDIAVTVDTPTGARTVSIAVSAAERAADPDPAPGEWSAAFQARLDAALNAAGVYVSAARDLTQWTTAESAGHRIASVTVNGAALTLTGAQPSFGLGGAFAATRSFTSAQASTGVNDDVPALMAERTVSLTLDTVWGARTVSATLQAGDADTLASAALRLNEALAAEGYDIGVVAVALSGGGAGLRLVAGDTHSIRGVDKATLGAQAHDVTLDPVDVFSHAANPAGTERAAVRAGRGAAVVETAPGATLAAPSSAAANWFPGRAFDVSIGGGARIATARAAAASADGAVYVLADVAGDSETGAIKGARDVALLKYDSAGTLLFSRMLGAARSASGYALAVSPSGDVAVAGAVEGALLGAAPAQAGADSFVTVYDADGAELWTQRRAASGLDEARAVAFAPDGGVIVAGRTAAPAGGSDGYVRGFSASGQETFARQFGTGGDDAATALLVRDDGAGGVEIVVGGVEDNRGVLRRFTYSQAAGFAAGAVRDIGYFADGAVSALAADGAALYVGGAVGADRLSLAATAQAAVAGQEGFVARLDIGLVDTGLDRASYLGSAKEDGVRALAVVNGAVYAAGVAGGVIAAQGQATGASGFLARLDDTGQTAWMRKFVSAAGALDLRGLATDPAGASALDALGLPRGVVAAHDSRALVERSALRAGDEFRVGADDGRMTAIRIAAGDTLASLAGAVNRALGAAGRAEIVREGGLERLKIAARSGAAVRLEAGPEGRDALAGLGLKPGIVAVNGAVRGAMKTFGLGLVAADLKLDSKTAIAATKAELSAAVSIVRQAYQTLLNPNAKPPSEEEKALQARRDAAGLPPEYYTRQLANYRAALARLGGG